VHPTGPAGGSESRPNPSAGGLSCRRLAHGNPAL
jgi:hypothetical protein